jgi:hypothetical protein
VSQAFVSGAVVEGADAVTEGAVVAPTALGGADVVAATEPGGADVVPATEPGGADVVPATEPGGADVDEPLLHPATASPSATARGRSRTGRIHLS